MGRFADQRGLTFIEVLVVIAILSLLFAGGIYISMQTFHGYQRRSERDAVVSVLQRARSRALANVNQHQWGACLDSSTPTSPKYVIFSGSYGSAFRKDIIDANPGVTIDITGAPAFDCAAGGIIFSQLSGKSSSATMTVTQGGKTSTISVNAAGTIDW